MFKESELSLQKPKNGEVSTYIWVLHSKMAGICACLKGVSILNAALF